MGDIDKIILSCNEDKTYSSFWIPVAQAYKKMFPECEIMLAFLTNRDESDPLVEEYRKYGTVKLFKPYSFFPEFGQAKMIRFLLASEQGDDVCYIDDIDLYPLKKSFITDKTSQRPKDHLLCVGGEVYNNNGCYPISQMTAEGYVWKSLINPKDLDFHNLLESYYKTPVKFDQRENIGCINDFAADLYFSDERLIRRLRDEVGVNVFEAKRGYVNFMDATIDRYDWQVNKVKLDNHGYENAHGTRPYNDEDYKYLVEYINNNY